MIGVRDDCAAVRARSSATRLAHAGGCATTSTAESATTSPRCTTGPGAGQLGDDIEFWCAPIFLLRSTGPARRPSTVKTCQPPSAAAAMRSAGVTSLPAHTRARRARSRWAGRRSSAKRIAPNPLRSRTHSIRVSRGLRFRCNRRGRMGRLRPARALSSYAYKHLASANTAAIRVDIAVIGIRHTVCSPERPCRRAERKRASSLAELAIDDGVCVDDHDCVVIREVQLLQRPSDRIGFPGRGWIGAHETTGRRKRVRVAPCRRRSCPRSRTTPYAGPPGTGFSAAMHARLNQQRFVVRGHEKEKSWAYRLR